MHDPRPVAAPEEYPNMTTKSVRANPRGQPKEPSYEDSRQQISFRRETAMMKRVATLSKRTMKPIMTRTRSLKALKRI